MQILNLIYLEEKNYSSWLISSVALDDTLEKVKSYYKTKLSSSSGEINYKHFIEELYDHKLYFIEENIYSPRTTLIYGESETYGYLPNFKTSMNLRRLNIKELIKNIQFSKEELEEIKKEKIKNIKMKKKFQDFLKEYKKKPN